MGKIMRSTLVFLCLFSSITPVFAEPIGSERYVPSQQYQSGTTKSATNGKATTTSKKSSDFLGRKETGRYSNRDYELDATTNVGYRESELKWNIASDITGTATPNIISELQWKNIGGYQFEQKIDYTQKKGRLKGLNLQASINKSITTSGENQDSDYDGNDRTDESSRSNNNSDAGHAEGFSLSIGYAFDFTDDRKKTLARFTTLVGYALQNQEFEMRDGFQTIPATGSFSGLNSSYDMELSMPFVGAELTSYFADVHHLKIRGRYSRGTYNGVGNWNLRADFMHPKSFEQEADGSGFLLGAEYGWQMYNNLQLTASANYNYFKTDHGTTTFYLSNGSTPIQRLNEAEWYSVDYMAGVNYQF